MQIWTPEIKVYEWIWLFDIFITILLNFINIWLMFLYSSLDMNYVNWSNLPIFCNNDGTLSMTTSFVSRTWCSSEDNIIMWPRDVHVCVLRLGSWSQHSQIDITSDELKDVPIFAVVYWWKKLWIIEFVWCRINDVYFSFAMSFIRMNGIYTQW